MISKVIMFAGLFAYGMSYAAEEYQLKLTRTALAIFHNELELSKKVIEKNGFAKDSGLSGHFYSMCELGAEHVVQDAEAQKRAVEISGCITEGGLLQRMQSELGHLQSYFASNRTLKACCDGIMQGISYSKSNAVFLPKSIKRYAIECSAQQDRPRDADGYQAKCTRAVELLKDLHALAQKDITCILSQRGFVLNVPEGKLDDVFGSESTESVLRGLFERNKEFPSDVTGKSMIWGMSLAKVYFAQRNELLLFGDQD